MSLLPFEKVEREKLVRREFKTDSRFGCSPDERPVDELLNYGVINLNKPKGPTSHQVSAYVQKILGALGRLDNPYKRIMIGGGGNIGRRLAHALEDDYQVKVIDHNTEHTNRLAAELNNATVLFGDISDRELLIDENIEHVDVFCAVTNDDEANIMSCMQAKRLGVRQVMALIKHSSSI